MRENRKEEENKKKIHFSRVGRISLASQPSSLPCAAQTSKPAQTSGPFLPAAIPQSMTCGAPCAARSPTSA
jgi:hypothetical protein